MPQIEIRPAQGADIPVLIDIDHDYQSSFVWQMDVQSDEDQLIVNFREVRLPRPVKVPYPRCPETMLEDWVRRPAVLVAVLAGEPVGYISLAEGMAPSTTWVTDLVVAPVVRRQGIASSLVMAAHDWATPRKSRRMILEMQSKNLPAIRMAQKLGYEFCGYNDHYYTNQDIAIFFAQFLR